MDRLVVDNSITISWCFADEEDDYAKAILRLMPLLEVFVPSHWPLEVVQCLIKGERRGRITQAGSAQFQSLLGSFSITIDEETATRSFREILALARAHQLSSYDAAYLECAMRRGIPLATLDDKLKNAAIVAGVELYDPERAAQVEGPPGEES